MRTEAFITVGTNKILTFDSSVTGNLRALACKQAGTQKSGFFWAF
jgi:hypothetical protein